MRRLSLRGAPVWLSLVLVATTGCSPPTVGDSTGAVASQSDGSSTATTIDELIPGATLASGFTATPPTARWVEGTLEFNEWLVTCAAEHGEMLTLRVGTISGAVPGTPRGSEVLEECWELAVSAGWAIPIPSDEDGQRLLYRLWVDVHECLSEAGYPTVEPPTEDAWIDAPVTGASRWNPYLALGGAPIFVMHDDPPSGGDALNIRAQEECGGYFPELYQDHLRRQDSDG